MQMITGVNSRDGDKDDVQSLVHALMYQDKLDIVGIASSTSKHQPGANNASFIHHVIDKYAKDQSALASHASGFKSAAELHSITYQGTHSLAGTSGYPGATAASAAIIREAREAAAAGEKLYVATWGGLGDVARALHDAPDIAGKIRLLSASGPAQEPNAHKYIQDHFAGEGALWWVDARTSQRGIYASPEGRLPAMSNAWAVENAKGHGTLGNVFYENTLDVRGTADSYNAVKMGDSYTTFYLIDQANNDDPTAESWGGEYRKVGDKHWVDRTDQDFAWSGSDGARTTYEDRAAWTNSFEARFDWLTSTPVAAPAPAPAPAPSQPSGAITGNDSANTLSGTSRDDTIYAKGGNDTLDGKGGSDRMFGGTGNDIYYVDRTTDQTLEAAGEGRDAVHSTVSWTLASNVEDLFLRSGSSINGTGNDAANVIIGNSGANTLSGKAGTDVLDGRSGNDRIIGGLGNDLLTGGNGDDLFIFAAGDGDDVITGFVAGGSQDRIQISGHDRYDALRQLEGGTLVVLGDDSIFLKDVRAASLTSGDFWFQ
jgi:Ca2+-binding RTX toxin-like protein